jgi:hypothetical protein
MLVVFFILSVVLIGNKALAQERATLGRPAVQERTKPAVESAEKKADEDTASEEWIQLFNGTDLTGWSPKIRGHEFGVNYADTFRVVDGLLTVSYDKYVPNDFLSMDKPGKADFNKFGHLFYKDTFSHYMLRVEYRFTGNQVQNGPGWAIRNNGLMLHGQDPAKMALDQKFPVSIEVQLLGGTGNGERSTLNLCTPGTNVVMNGELFKKHCTSSNSKTYNGDQWVTVEVEVRGSKVIRHKIDGETVLEYMQPQYDPKSKAPSAQPFIVDGKLLIEEGTISLQSESHPTQFRKIELKKLDPTE